MTTALKAADGGLPVAVTIAEPSVGAQADFAREAHDRGAQFVILQPPPVRQVAEADLVAFFGAVADQVPLPVAIQNAPDYIGIGVSNAGFRTLAERHPNVSIVKAEGPASLIAALAEATGGAFSILNGRNGIDLVDTLRAGGHGVIPGFEAADRQAAIYEMFMAGDEAGADAAFRELLPLLSYLMDSIDHLLCYGKRLAARRLGISEVHDRAPAHRPTAFGLAVTERWSRDLDPY